MHWNEYVNKYEYEYASGGYYSPLFIFMEYRWYIQFLNKWLDKSILYRIIRYYAEVGVNETNNRYIYHS